MKYTIAPDFQSLFRPLSEAELEQATANNEADPKHERVPPVVLWGNHENTVLDGHQTLAIRNKLGLKIRFVKMEFETRDEAMAYAIRCQLGRRNLSASELAIALAKMPKAKPGPKPRGELPENLPLSREELAEEHGISDKTLRYADKVNEQGAPAVVEAVQQGEVAVSDAAAIADLPHNEQVEALEAVRTGDAATLREAAEQPPELTAKEPELTDEWGAVVQPHAREAFEAVPLFDELLSLLRKANKLYKELADSKGGVLLQHSSFCINARTGFRHAGIANAISDLENCKPRYTICPFSVNENYKHGKNCTLCFGLYWVPKIQKGRVPDDLMEKAKAAACSA